MKVIISTPNDNEGLRIFTESIKSFGSENVVLVPDEKIKNIEEAQYKQEAEK